MSHGIARVAIPSAVLLIAASAYAEELRPFVLPSQNAPYRQLEQRAPAVSDSYYDKFRTEVSQMDKNRINELKTDFRKRLDDARTKQRFDELSHYAKMLSILEGR